MKSWLRYLKNGLARTRSQDRFAALAQSTERPVRELARCFIPRSLLYLYLIFTCNTQIIKIMGNVITKL
jgi:hypothetical protein